MSRILFNALVLLVLAGFSLFAGCHQKAGKEKPPAESSSATAAAPSAPDASSGALDIEESTPSEYRLNLPPHFGRWTGDRGRPNGLYAALGRDLEVYINMNILQMTNAGLIPVTVCWDKKAEIWSSVLPDLNLNSGAVLKEGGDLAWAMRKNSPQLKALLDDFFKTRRQGTEYGRIMAQRYLSVKAVKHSTSQQELQKFRSYVNYFQKYSEQYDFDYLMIAAQAYQESTLRQDLVSPRGAVGIMQVIPEYAAAHPINERSVHKAEHNIRAGTKMVAQIADTYFSDPGITRMNKTLLSFAAYNAGPNRIARLRREAQKEGLDPDKWFGNVELVVAKDIGQETVQYVSNIYKYYVAYKMAKDEDWLHQPAKATGSGSSRTP